MMQAVFLRDMSVGARRIKVNNVLLSVQVLIPDFCNQMSINALICAVSPAVCALTNSYVPLTFVVLCATFVSNKKCV